MKRNVIGICLLALASVLFFASCNNGKEKKSVFSTRVQKCILKEYPEASIHYQSVIALNKNSFYSKNEKRPISEFLVPIETKGKKYKVIYVELTHEGDSCHEFKEEDDGDSDTPPVDSEEDDA